MSSVVVERVRSAAQRREFLSFPWKHYRGDAHWIPPLRQHQEEMVGYVKHPFHERNTVQTFLARRGGEVCGRIAAVLNELHIHTHADRRGFFGFFECIDDQETANALFDAVRQWFADQGISKLRGPMNPSMNYELGLLIEGFDASPYFMMTYNPPYYARLMENYGFTKAQDMYAFWGHVSILPKIAEKLSPIAQQIIEHYNVRIRPLDRKHFKEDVRSFLSIYNRSLANMWGFVPMTDGEMEHMAEGLRYLIVPELAVGAEVDGQMVGASFALPDYNPRIKQIDGRLFPFGFLRLLRRRNEIKRVRVISTNVIPEYQRMGVGLVLMHGLLPKALEWKIEEAEFSWVLESNSLSRGSLKKGGAQISKTYRVYDYEDPRPAEPMRPERRWIVPALASNVAPPTTGALTVREAQSGRQRKDFVGVPWQIYRDDPHWVPPLLIEAKAFVSRKHPFYRHGEGTLFVAYRGATPVGRLLASDDPHCNSERQENVACFGLFECEENPETASALLDAAAAWARARGRAVLRGPIDYSTNYNCGLLIDGFDTPPRVMMNHNPIYYPALLEGWGLRKAMDLYAWWFTDPHNLVERWRDRIERITRRTGMTIRPFNNADFDRETQRCNDVYNASMFDHWGFVRLSDAEFKLMAKQLEQMAIADQVLLAEVRGRVVGFSVTVPDINEIIRPFNGRLTSFGLPINLVRLLRNTKHAKTARMMILDVVPDFRRRGVAEALIFHTLEFGRNRLEYTGAELSWTLEENYLVNSTIERVGGRRYKTYRVYEKPI